MSEPVRRLRSAAARLRAAAADVDAGRRTPPDPATGERWDAGQVLSHCAEMIPYWVGEVAGLVAAGGDAAFGRVKSDPARLARIEAGRTEDIDRLLDRVDAGVDRVEQLLGRLSADQLELVGRHSTLGSMSVAQILEEFLVVHLEQHADQLESLRG